MLRARFRWLPQERGAQLDGMTGNVDAAPIACTWKQKERYGSMQGLSNVLDYTHMCMYICIYYAAYIACTAICIAGR